MDSYDGSTPMEPCRKPMHCSAGVDLSRTGGHECPECLALGSDGCVLWERMKSARITWLEKRVKELEKIKEITG